MQTLQKQKKSLDGKLEYGIEEMCEDSWRWQSNNPNGYEVKKFDEVAIDKE